MPVPVYTPLVAGAVVKATDPNAVFSEFADVVVDLDRNNLTTRFPLMAVTCRYYFQAATPPAVGNVGRQIQIPAFNGTTNARVVYLSFRRPATAGNRTVQLNSFVLATGAAGAVILAAQTITNTTTYGGYDLTATAIVPGTNGLLVTFTTTAGNFELDEWMEIDLWIANEIEAAAEL